MVLVAPFTVRLGEDQVYEPDIIAIRKPRLHLLTRSHLDGAPDLVVEVLSPSTAAKDRKHKRRLYEAAGVPQYLLIDPAYRCVELYSLDAGGRYPAPEVLDAGESLTLWVAPGFSLTLANLFGWPLVAEENRASYG